MGRVKYWIFCLFMFMVTADIYRRKMNSSNTASEGVYKVADLHSLKSREMTHNICWDSPCVPKTAVTYIVKYPLYKWWKPEYSELRLKLSPHFTYQFYLGQLLASASRVLRTFNYLVSHMICNTQGWTWNLMKLYLIWGYGLTSQLEMTLNPH